MLKPCKSLEEFVKKYDKDLERILCKSFRKYINIEELPEVKNDVYAHLLEKKFFDTYDPTKAQFSTYLYTYLFKFLKSKKVKNDKDPTTHAMCIDAPVFEDSTATLMDIKDFTPDAQLPSDVLIDEQIERKIRETVKDKHRFEVHNPYKYGTLEHRAWELLSEPRTIAEIEDFISRNYSADYENPYHSKKEDVKHVVWNSFWKEWQTRVPICGETQFWVNVPGVKKVSISIESLTEREFALYQTILSNKNMNYMELLSQGFDDSLLHSLIQKGYVEEVVRNFRRKKQCVYVAVTESYLSFNFVKNLAWHMINLMRDEHPEFVESNGGFYHLNTKTDVTYKVLQMILNGKTKKKIASTLNISTGALNEARESMLRDIRKIMDI
jgi:hypothetical protein